jgi:hypothetical protein
MVDRPRFNPEMSRNEADKLVHNWDKAVGLQTGSKTCNNKKTLEDDTIYSRNS